MKKNLIETATVKKRKIRVKSKAAASEFSLSVMFPRDWSDMESSVVILAWSDMESFVSVLSSLALSSLCPLLPPF